MPDSTNFSCFIIGEGNLPIQCAEMLIQQGHTVYGVISSDPAVQRWANEHHILHSHLGGHLLAVLGQQPFDYLFSIDNMTILPADMLALPRKAAINYHNGPLPTYAGSFATFWALIHQEATHAVTWHEMSARIDAGNILKQRKFEIAPHETTLTLNAKCYEAALQTFAELVEDLAAECTTPTPQNLSERRYFPVSKRPAMGAVISWQQPAEAIDALVRALDFGPYPNPKGLPQLALGSEFLIIAELQLLDTYSVATPGTIVGIEPEELRIATPTRDIALRKLLTIDGQNLPLAKVVASFGLRQGDQLPAPSSQLAQQLTALHNAIAPYEEFWVERLAALQPLVLPFVERQPPAGTVARAQMPIPIPAAVRAYLAGSQETFSSFLRSAFVAYLARIGTMDEFDLGFSSIALRHELGALDRFFAATLPLRFAGKSGASYTELAQALDQQVAAMAQHKTYARDLLMRYPALRALQELRSGPALPVGVVEVSDLDETLPPADLLLAIKEADTTCVWIYQPDVLAPETVARMQRQFTILLQSLATNPGQLLADVPLLDDTDRRQILHDWNATARDYSRGCMHDLFAMQAARTPHAPAVASGAQTLTYHELDLRANQLARRLQMLGVGPESRVGLYVKRSLDLVVGVLGILKAGGAYVPLDPSYPQERLRYMLEDANIDVLVAQQPLLERLPEHRAQIVCLDADWPQIAQQTTEAPASGTIEANLAYVIYTSGSTGRPKGVLVTHEGLGNLADTLIAMFGVRAGSRVLQFASLSFDASVAEVLMTLLAGATLVLLPHDNLLPGLIDLLRDEGITHAILSPSVLALLPAAELPALETIVAGGEVCSADVVARWAPGHRFVNAYGPTEITVCATLAVCHADGKTPPIGRPIQNMQVYLLDDRWQPVPVGVPGELYVAGVGVTRGYLNRPELTAEKFIPNPFGQTPGSRLYRTGDLAIYGVDGQIEFLGRIDQQVKLRGFRIDLGEIEATLLRHDAVEQAVVLAHTDQDGGQRLIGYVVKRPAADTDEVLRAELHALLQAHLPAYMVPATILLLDTMPLTPNGKIDRKALLKLNWIEASRSRPYVAPRTPLEEALVSIWQEACRLAQIGVDDNFFDLGGNSLDATQIVSRVQRGFNFNLTIRDIFAAPTVAALAQHLLTHERQPGSMDRIAVALNRLWSMSPEERQRVLQQKKAK